MKRATIKEISELSGVNKATIRQLANKGLIKTNRDYNGWRIFPDPEETLKRIHELMMGEASDGAPIKSECSS